MPTKLMHCASTRTKHRTLCGRKPAMRKVKCYYATIPGTVTFPMTTQIEERITCKKCIRLLSMTSAQRDEERKERSASLRARFASKNMIRILDAAWRKLGCVIAADTASAHAIAALDYLQDPDSNLAGFAVGRYERERWLADVLGFALVAHRIANPSTRGQYHYVTSATGRGYCNVLCRYCRDLLMAEMPLGIKPNPRYVYQEDSETIRDHWIRCGLTYLRDGTGLRALRKKTLGATPP